ncbi:MAG: DUF2252 domain-containing protein [Pseudonocardia sp.]|nr:DUF2252 domain-containing protein [Pseudonocardia sp.]
MTPDERVAAGRAVRDRIPRSAHAEPGPTDDRDPVGLLESQAAARVPELVPIRYGRMLESPFAFYRGGALIMAKDLARIPRSDITVQLCGDAHLSNFGLFATPERRLAFDLNDFDETFPGPFEWDVKRLAASLAVAARQLDFGGPDRNRIVLAAVARYRTAMREFAARGNLEVWYASVDTDAVDSLLTVKLTKAQRGRLGRSLAKARTRDSMHAVGKLVAEVNGEYRIRSSPPLVIPISELLPEIERRELALRMEEIVAGYGGTMESDRRHLLASYRLVDIARKVVGVGSVGTRAWILLLQGRDPSDPLFLQAKEATASVLDAPGGPGTYENQGERVVTGQRLMQAASDIFLGWYRLEGIDGRERDFYLRQLRDWKGSVEVQDLIPDGMRAYGEVCGWTLARAHARSGDRFAIAGYLGRGDAFDRAVAEFAEAYADRNERDYGLLRSAVDSGQITARTGL